MPHRTRVLVVDDNRDMVYSLLALLETEGYIAKGIYSAIYSESTIVADVRDFNPDIIIMDIAMPGRTGWDAARQVRQDRAGKRPLLIATSGQYTKGADRVRADLSGLDYFVIKPCDPKALLKLVASYTAK